MSHLSVRRFVSVYPRNSDAPVQEIELSDSEFEALRGHLKLDPENPLYDCYPLEEHVLDSVLSSASDRLPEGDFEYFLETELDEKK